MNYYVSIFSDATKPPYNICIKVVPVSLLYPDLYVCFLELMFEEMKMRERRSGSKGSRSKKRLVQIDRISAPQDDFRKIGAIVDTDILPESVRRVQLVKQFADKPLGFYIRENVTKLPGNDRICKICISRLVPGGLAEGTGLLSVNDEIIEINGIEIRGKSFDQVTDMMIANSQNLIITIKPASPLPKTPPAVPKPASVSPKKLSTHVPASSSKAHAHSPSALHSSPILRSSPVLHPSSALRSSPALQSSPALRSSPAPRSSPALRSSLALRSSPGLHPSPVLRSSPGLHPSPVLRSSPAFKKHGGHPENVDGLPNSRLKRKEN